MRLKGYSGCKLELITNDKLIVRKTSKSFNYNERLQKQAEKQCEFNSPYFNRPTIVEHGFVKDLYYFDMDYIKGIIASEYFKTIKINEIENFCNLLFKVIPEKINYTNSDNLLIKRKIEELKTKIKVDAPEIKQAFYLLDNYKWDNIDSSKCHGDLTLENIIVNKDGIYFIDFLDSYYNSWMIDISKLLQDFETFWSYRLQSKVDENLNIRILIARKLLIKRLYSLENNDKIIVTIYHFLLLNILRIIPYVKTQKDLFFIRNKIKEVIKIL